MVQRNFAGRGMTLAQLNKATEAERARKAAATAQALQQAGLVNTANTAAANASATAAQPSKVLMVDALGNKVNLAASKPTVNQATIRAAPQAQTPKIAVIAPSQAKTAPVTPSRFARSGPVISKDAVAGKRLSEYQVKETVNSVLAPVTASKAMASGLQVSVNAPKGTNIIAPESSTVTYYDVDSNLSSIYKEALAAGVSVSAPKSYGKSLQSEAAARAAQENYAATVDKAYSDYNTAQQAAVRYTVFDDLGRQQNVTAKQLQQMQTWQQKGKSSGTYTVIPEEVANSGAEWWINEKGLYEWYPITAGDKAELARENKQRTQFHQAEKSTLTAGASPSASYSAQWYSTGGNRTQVSRNTKLAALKASSTVNNSASAKTNTAKTQKVTVVSASDTAKKAAETQKVKQTVAANAASEAKQAQTISSQAKKEAAAKQKLVTSKQAELKKAVSTSEKSSIKQDLKALQKEADSAKVASKAADAHAKSTVQLAEATNKAASTPAGSKASATAAKAVKAAQVKTEKTAASVVKAGVQDHTGQILLQDGTWLSQVQQKGLAGKGEKSVKLFGTTSEYQAQMAQQYQQKKQGRAVEKALNPIYEAAFAATVAAEQAKAATGRQIANNYKVIIGPNKEIIDAVQVNSKFGTGEGNVRVETRDAQGNTIAASKTAAAYNATLKTAVLNASLPINADTSAKDKKIIQNARDYVLARQSGAVKTKQLREYAKIDNPAVKSSAVEKYITSKVDVLGKKMSAVSKKGTEGARVGALLQNLSKGDLSTNVKTGVDRFFSVSDASLARAVSPMFNRIESVNGIVDSVLKNTSISVNDRGQVFIDKTGQENKKAKVTFNAAAAREDTINSNAVLKGVSEYGHESYAFAKNKPFSAAVNVGALYVGGAVAGTAVKGAGVALGMGLRGVSTALGTGKAAAKVYSAASRSEQIVNLGMGAKLAIDTKGRRRFNFKISVNKLRVKT